MTRGDPAAGPLLEHGDSSGPSRRLDAVFRISLILKGLDAALEIIGGVALLFVPPHSIYQLARWMVAHDLAGSPHDFIAHHLLRSASQLSSSTTLFGAVYLLSHGIAKLVLVVFVLRDKLWAYPWMIGLLIAFIIYQAYRFTYRPGPGLVILSVFDAFVAWLTWREYKAKRRKGASQHRQPPRRGDTGPRELQHPPSAKPPSPSYPHIAQALRAMPQCWA